MPDEEDAPIHYPTVREGLRKDIDAIIADHFARLMWKLDSWKVEIITQYQTLRSSVLSDQAEHQRQVDYVHSETKRELTALGDRWAARMNGNGSRRTAANAILIDVLKILISAVLVLAGYRVMFQ